jgi:hypothetical protein
MTWVFLFNLPNPSSRTMALGSTQALTEMSTRNLPGRVKGGWRVGLTILPSSMSRLCRKCGNLNVSQPHGPPMPFTRLAFPLPYITQGGVPFEFRPGHRLYRHVLFLWFSLVPSRKYPDSTSNSQYRILPDPFQFIFLVILRSFRVVN